MKEKTYFGLNVYGDDERYILENDIKKLPFYFFWKESARGTTCMILDEDTGVYLHDWENFCKLFIETGKHRLVNNEKKYGSLKDFCSFGLYCVKIWAKDNKS